MTTIEIRVSDTDSKGQRVTSGVVLNPILLDKSHSPKEELWLAYLRAKKQFEGAIETQEKHYAKTTQTLTLGLPSSS